jgi:C1A family cysteine protease
MKAILLLAILAVAYASPLGKLFLEFQHKYNKIYHSQEEFDTRFEIFRANLRRAEENQRLNPNAKFGITKFMDLAPEEFSRLYKMTNLKDIAAPQAPNTTSSVEETKVSCKPTTGTWDWGSCNGVITPVRNQGQCGSCWAFSATENIESYCVLAGASSEWYSVEQIVDCDTSGEDQGCNGGWPSGAYTYIKNAGGIETETAYPYTAGEGEGSTCQFNVKDAVCTITGWKQIQGESGLYQQVSTAGPVSVCVDASSWQTYTGGVLSTCGTSVDHCVQLTGYVNYGKSGAYWNVRNSWGTDWGVNGYIWIQIGSDLCDIGDYATVPQVKVL